MIVPNNKYNRILTSKILYTASLRSNHLTPAIEWDLTSRLMSKQKGTHSKKGKSLTTRKVQVFQDVGRWQKSADFLLAKWGYISLPIIIEEAEVLGLYEATWTSLKLLLKV